ncbi:MAG TPA: thioredoxin domain-containing protein [Candidatus Paceibacterota bacterium]|jgi:protein-disulfide isomerase|nr:thioredoxin domain-containing protein [Candidatus Paceibacterota bacterium]
MEQNSRSQIISIPGAIIIGCTILAIGYFVTQRQSAPADTAVAQVPAINVAPVTSADHILGNPNAPIKVVEYSDPSCPFCKMFSPTMNDIIKTYGNTGKVAWVYRNFPLDEPNTDGSVLHPNASTQSQAFECAASLGGNDKFWAFEKEWYSVFPLQGATNRSVTEDNAQLVNVAKTIGLDAVSFNDCLSSGQFKSKIDDQRLSGMNAGVSGTPTSFFLLSKAAGPRTVNLMSELLISYKLSPSFLYLSNDRKIIMMSGAMPKELITKILDTVLSEI